MDKQEMFERLHKAHDKYVEWWLPIDTAGDSFLAPMSFSRFLETLLVYDNNGWYTIPDWWNEWLYDLDSPIKRYTMKRFILDLLLGHHSGAIDVNKWKY